jgi:hypothetical protein
VIDVTRIGWTQGRKSQKNAGAVRNAYLFVCEQQCPDIENAASDMAKQDSASAGPRDLLHCRGVLVRSGFDDSSGGDENLSYHTHSELDLVLRALDNCHVVPKGP